MKNIENKNFILESKYEILSFESKLQSSILSKTYEVFGFYILFFSVAEIFAVSDPIYGILLHCICLLLLSIHGPLLHKSNPLNSKLLLALIPVPLVRIVSITSPLIQFTMLQWFLVISMILFSSILMVIYLIGADIEDYGVKLPARKDYTLEIMIVLSGLLFGFIEYQILQVPSLIENLNLPNLLAPLVALYFGTGLLEELLFRGIIQKHSIDLMGKWNGIIYTTIIFMILHTGWQSYLDIIFVGVVGFIFSLVVHRTGSILGVSFAHAVTNLSLFVLTPEILVG